MPRTGKRKPIIQAKATEENVTLSSNTEKTEVRKSKYFSNEQANGKSFPDGKDRQIETLTSTKIITIPQPTHVKTLIANYNASCGPNNEKKILEDSDKANRKKHVILLTTSFLLGYNQIRDITSIKSVIDSVMFDAFKNLQWLDLQHNYLTTLSPELGEFENLKTLYLHANYISNMKELLKIKGLTQLRNLTIHGNPLARIPNFRLYIILIFPDLKKLDTVLVSSAERDKVQVWSKTFNLKKLPAYTENDVARPPMPVNPVPGTKEH